MLEARAQCRLDAGRGERARVPSTAMRGRSADHVRGPSREQCHVVARRTHVLGRDVAAIEELDRLGDVVHDLLAEGSARRIAAGRKADDRLSPAERELGCRGLERHRA